MRQTLSRCRAKYRKTFTTSLSFELNERIGTVALKLHTGRSTQRADRHRPAPVRARCAIDAALVDLLAWCGSLLSLAESAGEHAMPSYTHLQRAEPVLIAHWLLAYVPDGDARHGPPPRCAAPHELLPAWLRADCRRNASKLDRDDRRK